MSGSAWDSMRRSWLTCLTPSLSHHLRRILKVFTTIFVEAEEEEAEEEENDGDDDEEEDDDAAADDDNNDDDFCI